MKATWRCRERLDKRNYPDIHESAAFIHGYGDGFHDEPQKQPNELRNPNAYSAGYWEGFADRNEP